MRYFFEKFLYFQDGNEEMVETYDFATKEEAKKKAEEIFDTLQDFWSYEECLTPIQEAKEWVVYAKYWWGTTVVGVFETYAEAEAFADELGEEAYPAYSVFPRTVQTI